ncbi:MAG: hypothetical protein ACQEP8_03320 [Chlamydiota bacterium]
MFSAVGMDLVPVIASNFGEMMEQPPMSSPDDLVDKISSLTKRINCGGRPAKEAFQQILNKAALVSIAAVPKQAEIVDKLVGLSRANRRFYDSEMSMMSYYPDNPGYEWILSALGIAYGVVEDDVLRNKIYDEALEIPQRVILGNRDQVSALADGVALRVLFSKDILLGLQGLEARVRVVPDSIIFGWAEWKVVEVFQKVFDKRDGVNRDDMASNKVLEERVWLIVNRLNPSGIEQLRGYIKKLHSELLKKLPYEQLFEPYNELPQRIKQRQSELRKEQPLRVKEKPSPKRLGSDKRRFVIPALSPSVCEPPIMYEDISGGRVASLAHQ